MLKYLLLICWSSTSFAQMNFWHGNLNKIGSIRDSCQQYYQAGNRLSSNYKIRSGSSTATVYCDMVTDGGGWTRFSTVTISNGKYSSVVTPVPAQEFLGKYTGMIYYNFYGSKKDTQQIFDVYVQGVSKTCYSAWHNTSLLKTNQASGSGTIYNYYREQCSWSTGNYEIPTPGSYRNSFSQKVPAGTIIYFGDNKNLSGDYSWDAAGYTGSETFEIYYR